MNLAGVTLNELRKKAQEIIETPNIRATIHNGCLILRGGPRKVRNSFATKVVHVFNATYGCMDAMDQFVNIPHAEHVRILIPESD